MPTPVAPPGASKTTTTKHGTVYFYEGPAAAKAVSYSLIRVQEALEQQQANAAAEIARKFGGHPDFIDPITIGIIASIAAATAGAVGAAAAIGSAVASAAGAGATIAGLAMQSTATGGQALELGIHNDGMTPLIPVSFINGGCSIASTCRPLLPGASGAIDVVHTSPGFVPGSASVDLSFLSGGGVYLTKNDDGTQTPILLEPVGSWVQFKFVANGGSNNWQPGYLIDSHNKSEMFTSSHPVISAAYFQPYADVNMLALTIASYLSPGATSTVDVLFLPGSAIVTPAQANP